MSEGCLSSLDIVCSILFQRSNGWRIICERVAFQHLQVESKCNMLSLILTYCGKLPQVSGDQQTFIALLPSRERHAHVSWFSTTQHWSVIPRFHEANVPIPAWEETASGWRVRISSQRRSSLSWVLNDKLELPR